MESMMQSFLTKNAEDAATYTTIATMQQEVADDKQELAALYFTHFAHWSSLFA
jgi:hypothetical protein